MDSFSDDADIGESLFVEGNVCIRLPVADNSDENCDDSSPQIGDVFNAFLDDDDIVG